MDKSVSERVSLYPKEARERFVKLRAMLFDLAESEGLGELAETTKWGEPSYKSKIGSPVRIDWKSKNPKTISLYFNCNTKLVATFREVYPKAFNYEGNREVIIPLSDEFPRDELAHCLLMALKYHELKGLSLLGA